MKSLFCSILFLISALFISSTSTGIAKEEEKKKYILYVQIDLETTETPAYSQIVDGLLSETYVCDVTVRWQTDNEEGLKVRCWVYNQNTNSWERMARNTGDWEGTALEIEVPKNSIGDIRFYNLSYPTMTWSSDWGFSATMGYPTQIVAEIIDSNGTVLIDHAYHIEFNPPTK